MIKIFIFDVWKKKVNYYFVISLNYIGGLLNINKFNMKL